MNYKLSRELPYANVGDKVLVHTAQKYIEVESTKYEVKRFIGMGNFDDLDDYILEGWIEQVLPIEPRECFISLKQDGEGKWWLNDVAEYREDLRDGGVYKIIKVREVIE